MLINAARYSLPDNSQVYVTTSEGAWFQAWPGQTYHTQYVRDWLLQGNTIAPYDEYADKTLDEAKVLKRKEGELYGRELVAQAYGNPYDAIFIVDTGVYREKTQSKRRLRSDKKALGKKLTSSQEVELERDEVIQEYEVDCIESSNEFEELVNEQITVPAVSALDPATAVTWPVWTPPA